MTFLVAPITLADQPAWIRMRRAMGPTWFTDDIESFTRSYFESGTIQGLPHCVLVAREHDNSEPIGFAEVSLRDYAEGCLSSPVAYLEGWYVEPAWHRRGVGRALLREAERWAVSQGCTEFASDSEIDNAQSIAAHQALGFTAVCSIMCFHKRIATETQS